MDAKETVQALMDSVQKGDFEKAKSLLSDDFTFSGPVPEPINADAWMGMSMSLKNAFPDLDYQFNIESMDGDTANISAELKGTHSGDFDLTAMHMGVIPATNKSFAAAHEHGKITVNGDKITAWATEATEGAGLMAILGQLGVKPPEM
jgi:predicted ester cyclase